MDKRLMAIVLIVFAMLMGDAAAQKMKYRVTTTVDKHADFSKLKTYTWQAGWDSYDPAMNRYIEAAVEHELMALGFTKAPPGASDVTVTYATLRRTDTDFKAKATREGILPTYAVGTLVVLIRDCRTHADLYRARTDTPINLAPETIEATVNNQVAELFADYPTRHEHEK